LSSNFIKKPPVLAAPRPNHIPPCIATATAVAALKPSVARGNGSTIGQRSDQVKNIGKESNVLLNCPRECQIKNA